MTQVSVSPEAWDWMIIVFEHAPAPDVVYVLAIEDGRSSTALTNTG